ncbi:hypothetical protein M405DRAFT_748453 [Rhizopogon salebrosus TDB-379]|nr:hypothetical protein M405DRAFT_748453 [Rhizopogon salebrosus TDB-379]
MIVDVPCVFIDARGRVLLWYLPGTINNMIRDDMYAATVGMGDLLKKSVTAGKAGPWRTDHLSFHEGANERLTPGCINLSPCWFQQGHEVLGHAAPKFSPEVSATLKGDHGTQLVISMNLSAILASAALRVMHPALYFAGVDTLLKLGRWARDSGLEDMCDRILHWASVFNVASIMCNRRSPPHRDPKCRPEAFDIMTSISVYHPTVMNIQNFSIKLRYDSCVMVAFSCRLAVHGMHVESGDRIVWAWFMRDSVHNFVATPRPDFARYDCFLEGIVRCHS